MLDQVDFRQSVIHISTAILYALVFTFFTAVFAGAQDPPSRSFSELAKRVEPAVVSIDTKSKVSRGPKATSTPGDSDDILEYYRQQLPQRPVYAVGSGFIVDKGGYVITNAHVVGNAARITVKLDSGEAYDAKLLGADEETDIAVLKIEARRDLPFIKFGDSTKAEVGDWVLAIGSPFGLTKTVTAGIISQTRRESPYASAFQRFIQTDAAINPGNSGGPLVNMSGEAIGVNSQIATTTGDYNGVGFAFPSNECLNIYNQILRTGKVRRGYLGAYLDSVRSEFASVYGMSAAKGAIVTDIRDKQSPAGVYGLQVGDVVVEFNGQPVENAQDLINRVGATLPDETVSLVYLREAGNDLERKTASIKLAERPSNSRAANGDDTDKTLIDTAKGDVKPFGLTLLELTPILTDKYKLTGQKGVVIKEIDPASFIADVKNSLGGVALGEGDLIQRINRIPVTDLKSFTDVASRLKPGDAVVLHVKFYDPQSRAIRLEIVQFTVR